MGEPDRSARGAGWWTRPYRGIPAPRLIAAGVGAGVIAVVLTLAGGLAQAAAPEPTPGANVTSAATPSASPTVVEPVSSVSYVGDSLTAGWNASSQAHSFRALISAGLAVRHKLDADSAIAIAGATTAEVNASLGGRVKADLVVVALGTNDVSHKTDINDFRTSYTSILGSVQADQLVCVGAWRTDDRAWYDAVVEEVCEASGGTFVEIGDLRDDPTMVGVSGQPAYPNTADGGHPSDLGHQAIAARVLAAVE